MTGASSRSHESRWIDKTRRISVHIGIGIQTAGQSNRIALQIASRSWVVIPEVVLMEACFAIENLTSEQYVICKRSSLSSENMILTFSAFHY